MDYVVKADNEFTKLTCFSEFLIGFLLFFVVLLCENRFRDLFEPIHQ